jgi:hypothetical protein
VAKVLQTHLVKPVLVEIALLLVKPPLAVTEGLHVETVTPVDKMQARLLQAVVGPHTDSAQAAAVIMKVA